MAERRKGIVARWLEGKEREETCVRTSLPESRWGLFWSIFKGRFGKLCLLNLLTILFFLPLLAIIFYRTMSIGSQGLIGPFGDGLGVGYPAVPNVVGVYEFIILRSDLIFFAMIIPALIIAGVGISGCIYVVRNMLWTDGVFVMKNFWNGVKRNFWSVFEAAFLFGIVLFVARYVGDLADYYVARGASLAGWLTASKVIGYLLLALTCLISLWMISLGLNYKQGPWALFRNAVVMTFSTFPQTVLFAGLATWPIFLFLFAGSFFMLIGLMILIFFAISYACLVWLDYSQWAFDKFIEPSLGVPAGKGAAQEKGGEQAAADPNSASEKEIRRLIVAQGKSALASRPIQPIDEGGALYELPETFSRGDLKKLRESKGTLQKEIDDYAKAHENDARFVEYNKLYEERERAIREEDEGGKKKNKIKPPRMLDQKKRR